MTKRSLVQKINKEFPDLKWHEAEHNVEGWDHYVLILDNKYVFRFPRTEFYVKRLRDEIQLLQYLKKRKLGVSIPEYKFIADKGKFAGYSMLQAEQMTNKVFQGMSLRQKKNVAKKLGKFLSVLHKTPLRVAKKYGTGVLDHRERYKNLVLDAKKYIKPRISQKNYGTMLSFLKEFKEYQNFPNYRFIHSDLYFRHIIIDKRKNIFGIIDFSDRRIGDPSLDFGELHLYGEDFVREVYKNYSGKKDKDFLYRSKLYYKCVPLNLMIMRIKDRRESFAKGYKMFKELFVEEGKL